MASDVFFTDLRTGFNNSLLDKLGRVMDKAGFGSIDFEDKYAVIKMHFGEPGNLAFLRPNWAKAVADKVKEKGGKPFLSDCNTLYVGGRKNALDHLDSAAANGFSPLSTGCQIIIGDGLKGLDDVEVPVDGEYVKEYDDVENIANMFLTNYFMGINSFDYLNQIGMVDVEYLTQVLNDVFKEEKMVISIVKN